jgi:hypothetical protein
MTYPARPATVSSAGELIPGRLYSLWDIMKAFNAALLAHAFSSLAAYSQQETASGLAASATPVGKDRLDQLTSPLVAARVIATMLGLTETSDAIQRLSMAMKSSVEPITHVTLHYALEHLIDLMKNQLDKRKVFALDATKSKYYQADEYGVFPPQLLHTNALAAREKLPEPLFSPRAITAFPSAYMDIVEAGRCLALERNNAAIYHLMQVAEVGLRTLAWDRRAKVIKWKKEVPLEFSQWGDLIVAVRTKRDLINNWPRSKAVKEEANRYYTRAIFEVDSFNEIFRKHISHARNELYESDVAISCWGHVYRFMDMLAERMSETVRTPNVWNSPKKAKS